MSSRGHPAFGTTCLRPRRSTRSLAGESFKLASTVNSSDAQLLLCRRISHPGRSKLHFVIAGNKAQDLVEILIAANDLHHVSYAVTPHLA